jgi:hypothetical protein
MLFDTAEAQLCHELHAYFEAIHSYPQRFAQARVSFQEHLHNLICGGYTEQARGEGHEPGRAAS